MDLSINLSTSWQPVVSGIFRRRDSLMKFLISSLNESELQMVSAWESLGELVASSHFWNTIWSSG